MQAIAERNQLHIQTTPPGGLFDTAGCSTSSSSEKRDDFMQ